MFGAQIGAIVQRDLITQQAAATTHAAANHERKITHNLARLRRTDSTSMFDYPFLVEEKMAQEESEEIQDTA